MTMKRMMLMRKEDQAKTRKRKMTMSDHVFCCSLYSYGLLFSFLGLGWFLFDGVVVCCSSAVCQMGATSALLSHLCPQPYVIL